MDTTNESTETSIDSKFAYTWYQDFTYADFNFETLEPNQHYATLRLPLISKDEYFIVQNDESMKHDGLSLKQRLWFRDQPSQEVFRMWNGEEAVVTIPVDRQNGMVLNYKKESGSILNKFFNIVPNVDSNYATVECYLTPLEYLQIKNGAMVMVDTDLYLPVEITGFDPTCNNKTTLTLMKV